MMVLVSLGEYVRAEQTRRRACTYKVRTALPPHTVYLISSLPASTTGMKCKFI